MPSEISGSPGAVPQEAQQRKALRTGMILVLVSVGLGLIVIGLPGMVSGEMKVGLGSRRFQHMRQPSELRKQRLELGGHEARWFGGGLVSVGCGLVLALALVPRAVDAHFRRTSILSLPYWQLGVFGGVVILVIGGLVGICASFSEK